jgi:fibro-slime domain-containing protein
MFTVEPCAKEGEERPCRGVCGEGIQRCEEGFYGECVVPPAERACSNDCGTGVQQCVDERWLGCDVPFTERDCVNQCGGGIQGCTDGTWGECEVPPVDFPCATECGGGTQRCEDGVLAECDVPIMMRECSTVCGSGHETCEGGFWGPCDAPQPRPPVLTSYIRDFMESHPDFEIDVRGGGGDGDPGIVQFELGVDDKPVYQTQTVQTPSTTGREDFDQWYRDVPGVNWTEEYSLPLAPSPDIPGFFVYHDDTFFPIDDQLFGNEGHPHNYHFTLETRTTFEYRGGETFSFTGDDDMWVFINRRLAIDLGGLHSPRSASVDLDSMAPELGITVGNIYTLHFFFAERHTVQSTFNIETSIADPGSCE